MTTAAEMYESALGRQARERQERLAKDYFTCCGEHKDDGHHEACSKRPADAPVPVHVDQVTLL